MDSSYIFTSDLNDSNALTTQESSQPPIASTSQLPSSTLPASLTPPLPSSRKESIESAIKESDVKELQRLSAQPRGFESSEIRRTVWYVIVLTMR